MAAFQQPFLTPITPSMPLCPPLVQEKIESLPMTPPDPVDSDDLASKPDSKAIKLALHVISTERAALSHLETLYHTDDSVQQSLAQSVGTITRTAKTHGKLVITGIGKSGKIGEKLVATFNSLGIHACFLHPTEALHGDLGVIKPNDTVLMITFSGRTPELLMLLPHISPTIPVVVLTAHTVSMNCPIIARRANSILLPAPIHESEQTSFGISAPTSSTTVALALGDSLALAVAETLHTTPGKSPSDIFHSHHPGGAIGASVAANNNQLIKSKRMTDIATLVSSVPIVQSTSIVQTQHLTTLDVLLTVIRAPKAASGWVRTSPVHVIAPRRIRRYLTDPATPLFQISITSNSNDQREEAAPLIIEKNDWISVLGACTVEECRAWILQMRQEVRGRGFLRSGTVLGIVDEWNEVSGVVEIEDVVGEDLCGGGMGKTMTM